MSDVTRFLNAIAQGDRQAAEKLMAHVILFDLARSSSSEVAIALTFFPTFGTNRK
jgi:hypothetical protein